jgi:DNA invertase Pin-like site-specific DNA recombinase
MKMKKQGVSYVRVSRKDQVVENQLIQIRNYCEREGIEITEQYIDSGFSGKDSNRPAFNRLMEDVRAGKVKLVVFSKVDRIGRSVKHLCDVLQEFRNRKIEVVFTSQGIDTSRPEGRLFWNMLAAFAEFEREMIIDRTLDGLDRAKAEGKRLGRPAGAKDKGRRVRSGYWLRWQRERGVNNVPPKKEAKFEPVLV